MFAISWTLFLEEDAPTIEGLHKDKFPRLQYVEIKEVTLRMLPDEWQAEEDDWDEVEAVLEDVDNGVTFPANEDVAEANAIIVEWFCIRQQNTHSPNTWEKAVARSCWDRIKEDEDVAVAERGEELVMEGDETEESPWAKLTKMANAKCNRPR